ncbi:DUF1566 domain-containing protein [Flavobacteriaceae bacterium]|nr:DUF1566 domain-containing protein [Flavobacteriaceae bacterium]
MRKITVIVLMLFTALSYAQVGINIATPHTSSALDVTSTSAGFLPPRMTAVQRADISDPALGLMVFCTNCASGDGELQVNYASGWKNAAGGDITDPPQIGDYRDGGIVFYIASTPVDLDGDGDLDTGLVCAIQDHTNTIAWILGGSTQTTANGGTLASIGQGQTNTTAMMGQAGYTGGAAKVCNDYSITVNEITYSDWFLPSKDELNQMYEHKATINTTAAANGGSIFSTSYYWSSTEFDVNAAWFQSFYNGFQDPNYKDATYNVRAVRAF